MGVPSFSVKNEPETAGDKLQKREKQAKEQERKRQLPATFVIKTRQRMRIKALVHLDLVASSLDSCGMRVC